MEHHLGPFAVAIVFWIFVTVAAVSGIVADYKKRKAALGALQAAIERGQQLEPALVERLMAPDKDPGPNPLYLRMAGIITLFAGVGAMALAGFLSRIAQDALFPILGVASLVVCIGAGLMVAARAIEQHRLANPKNAQAPGAPHA